jgi:hypothetical protein
MTSAGATEAPSAAGEREFLPRTTGTLFPWVKWTSIVELGIFGCLLVVWLVPGLEEPTFWFGMAHGIGFILLCILIWIAVLRREVPFWLLASALTPVGPVGSSLGVAHIERKERRELEAFNQPIDQDDAQSPVVGR